MKLFKDKVRDRRGQLGLSQKELAAKAGIGFRTLATYESGERFPQSAQLYKLAKALDVSTEYLRDDMQDDPESGRAQMEYVEEVRRGAGTKDALDLEEMLSQNRALFAGGQISDEAKDAYFRAVTQAYLDCKKAASDTYGRR